MKVLKLFKTLENVSFATNIVGSEEEEEHKRSLSREGEYTIHHVLQQVVFLHFMSHEEKIKSFNSALSILEMLFPKQEKFEDFRTNAVRDRHSIIAFHTLAVSQHILSLEDISGLNNVHSLFTAVSTYLFRLGRAKDAKSLCKAMLHISRLRKLDDNLQFAEELTYLGRAYFQTKTLDKAERYFSDSIDVYKGISGEENIEVLKVKQRLGRAMQDNEDYMKDSNKREEIERLLTETLNMKKKIFENKDEKDHYTVAHALHQLGCFYQNTGEFEKAEDMLKESLEMRKRYWKRKYGTIEVEDVAIGMTLLARNNILNSRKDIEETKTILTSALEIKEKCMVSTNESYQLGLYYLAMLYHIIGDDSNSRDYLSKIEIEEYRTLFNRNRDEKDRAKVFEVEMVWM
ncbi:nephrocystin-3-like [Ptychodera flava]|uniref:nephrocystin-3-like n=1 Tax=Ptychodera flava TaxID=63121 RepID=UPI003969C765